MFCSGCGTQIIESSKFCSNCGTPLNKINGDVIQTNEPVNRSAIKFSSDIQSTLKKFFVGDGEVIINKITPFSTTRRLVNVVTKEIHHLKINGTTIEKQSKGKIILTENAIICNNNQYPFQHILGTAKESRSVSVALLSVDDKKQYMIKLDIKSNDVDNLFRALEEVRSVESNVWVDENQLKNVGKFVKDRIGFNVQ